MKPIQPHKDPRITNISFDNFTGSICIITPISDDDEESKDLMLSSPQTNSGADLFKPNHHLALITQPLLGARSRRKDKIDSVTNSRRSSYNDTSLLTLPINRVEKFHHEKKTNFHESSDSGLDFSLSTNSSVQYSQQQPIVHRPLSALNEDPNTDDGFHDQPIRRPVVIPGHYYSMENVLHDNHSNSSSNEIRKSNDELHLETNLQPSVPVQPYRSLNDLTNTTHTIIPKPLRKKTKLNIIIEPSVSLLSSSRLNINDEQIHPINRIPSSTSSSNQTTSQLIRIRNQPIKPKAITPLGHYPNQEQIRAHINRSVIERQHPPYLPVQQRNGQNFPSSKVNNLLSRQVKQPTNVYRSNPTIPGGNSMLQNLHGTRQTKQFLPDLYHEETHHEKRRLNEINKWQENSQKVKAIQEPLKTNLNRRDHLENFLTSTPRHHYEHGQSIGKNQRQQQSIYPKYKSKPTGLIMQNKTRIMNSKIEFDREYLPRNPIAPFPSPSKKRLRIPNIENPFEQIHQTMNTNNIKRDNELNRLTKINLTQRNKEQNKSNRLFQARSPTSWSMISEQYRYELSPSLHKESIHEESTRTFRFIPNNEQQPLDGRYVIPTNNLKPPVLVDCASQTSAPHVHTTDSNDINVDHSPSKLNAPDDISHRSCSSSSLDRFSPHDRFPLPLGKLTVAMEEDDISTNYDSDDGWSDDSVELLYADERYVTQKKKNISSSSSLQQHSHHHIQQQNVLLQ